MTIDVSGSTVVVMASHRGDQETGLEGILTLLLAGAAWRAVQRALFSRRQGRRQRDPARVAAGLPPRAV